jgi:hypothetical protein
MTGDGGQDISCSAQSFGYVFPNLLRIAASGGECDECFCHLSLLSDAK